MKKATFITADVDAILDGWAEGNFKKTEEGQEFSKSIAEPIFTSEKFMKFSAELTANILASVMREDVPRAMASIHLFIELGYRLAKAEAAKEKETVNA